MFLYWSVNKELYFNLGESIWFTADWPPSWPSSAVQKIKKLSETPVTVYNIAKLCVIDGKNREIIGSAIFGTPKIAKNAFWGVPKMALGVPESKF